MVHGEGHNSTGPAPSRSPELYRRCRVQGNEGQIRLDALPECVSSDQRQSGTTGSGPLCLQTDNPTFIFRELEAGPGGNSHRCLHSDLDKSKGMCQPTLEPGGKGSLPGSATGADLILVAPVWKTQPWYPTVLEMCKDFPLLIPQGRNLIQPTHPQAMPDVVPQLAVWNISGDNTKSNNFRRKLRSSCSHHGERNPPRHMTHNSENGLAGAVKGVQIPFHALSVRW